MSKVLKEAAVTTRNARAKLAAGVHWRSIDPDTHLGYRRGERGGRWLVRWYKGDGSYAQETLATADDSIQADGDQTLTFAQAASRARGTVKHRRAEAAAAAAGPVVTVRIAVDNYLVERERREVATGARKRDARSRLTKHVLSDKKLSSTALFALTERNLSDWQARLKGLASTTVHRLVNDLKAALNEAARDHREALPANAAAIIKNGLKLKKGAGKSVARSAQVLPDTDITRIIKAAQEVDVAGEWQGDLARLIVILAATGARFSQIVRLTVADVQIAASRLMVPASHKGNGAKDRTHEPVPVGADVLAALRPAIAGRKGGEPLLLRPRWKQTSQTEWQMTGRAPWRSAAELTRPWAEIIKRAKLPAKTVPYALRHSSIVRALRALLPTRLVAALHDTSTAMIERHYGREIASALDKIASSAVVPLMPKADGAKVVALRA